MARPQVEDGYTRIANELLEAVIAYPFSKRQVSVLLAVFRQTYGFNRKEAEMSLGTLSARTKIDKANVSRTLSELEGLGVLTKRSAPTGAVISINKDYERWGCQIGNVAKTATEGLPKQQPKGCQNSNPYKDSFKDKGKTSVFITPERVITFDDFWTPYPHKVSKSAALKAWEKLKPTPEQADEILAALEAQKTWRAVMQAAGEWIPEWPHGSTWLNGRRWEDELSAPKNLTNAGPRRPSGDSNANSGRSGSQRNQSASATCWEWIAEQAEAAGDMGGGDFCEVSGTLPAPMGVGVSEQAGIDSSPSGMGGKAARING